MKVNGCFNPAVLKHDIHVFTNISRSTLKIKQSRVNKDLKSDKRKGLQCNVQSGLPCALIKSTHL